MVNRIVRLREHSITRLDILPFLPDVTRAQQVSVRGMEAHQLSALDPDPNTPEKTVQNSRVFCDPREMHEKMENVQMAMP